MNTNAWIKLFGEAKALLASEPILTQVMVYLGLAFVTLMLIEGLRMSFMPRRRLIQHLQRHLPDHPEMNSAIAAPAAEPAIDVTREPDLRGFRAIGTIQPSVGRRPRELI
jgi:hypothetical protein